MAFFKRSEWVLVTFLVIVVTGIWCSHYRRWSKNSWTVPVAYIPDKSWDMASSGDAIWGMAATKARADGDISFFNKRPISFGAPFRANWNNWPSIEEAVDIWWALLAGSFGLFIGSNLTLLSAHLLAAVSFYFVCRHLRYDASMAFAGAVLFALSRYAFWRGLPHLTLTFYWHLPLVLLVLWWCVREESISGNRNKLGWCLAIVVLTGLQNAYYSAMFLQLLFWAALFCLLRPGSRNRAILPVALAGLLLATIAFANVDTFFSWRAHGSHLDAVPRTYSEGELYALRPVELFLPRSHSLNDWALWANRIYFNSSLYSGEEGSVYLGLAGMVALVWLIGTALWSVVRGTPLKIPLHFWGVFLVACFSVVGGLNGLIGLFGMHLFRSSNRYSIVILTILLLFLVKELTRLSRRWKPATVVAFAALLVAIGLYDQVPPGHPEQEATTRKDLVQEADLVSKIEASLPQPASVFQLPVRDFPESAPLNAMVDYENFRPYLHSRSVRFSYGDAKVEDRPRWQKEAEQFAPKDLIEVLESYGFDAILINRRGYADRGASLIDDLGSAGSGRIVAESEDFICLRLNPAQRILFPPVFGPGWYELEGDYEKNLRWSSGNATLVLYNGDGEERAVRITCGVAAPNSKRLKIVEGGRILYEAAIDPNDPPSPVDLRVVLHSGENELHFITDKAFKGATEDPRKLDFRITDFRILAEGSGSSQPESSSPASVQ